MRLGVISDTHGLLRPEAVAALAGCDRIVHAGDVGDRAILDDLTRIAPVAAIRGNVDRGDLARQLPPSATIEMAGTTLYILHDRADLDFDPRKAGISVVISGHTHFPVLEERGGVLYLNPGSAGPRRFDLPVAVAIMILGEGKPRAEIVTLDVPGPLR
jgi:putative phosphoesterase